MAPGTHTRAPGWRSGPGRKPGPGRPL